MTVYHLTNPYFRLSDLRRPLLVYGVLPIVLGLLRVVIGWPARVLATLAPIAVLLALAGGAVGPALALLAFTVALNCVSRAERGIRERTRFL